MATKTMKQFEKSGKDKDKGVKEGSAGDKKRDAKQFKKFKGGK